MKTSEHFVRISWNILFASLFVYISKGAWSTKCIYRISTFFTLDDKNWRIWEQGKRFNSHRPFRYVKRSGSQARCPRACQILFGWRPGALPKERVQQRLTYRNGGSLLNRLRHTLGQCKTRRGLCVNNFNSHMCYSFMHLSEEPGSLSAEDILMGISISKTPIKLPQHSSSPIYSPYRATWIFSLKLPLSLSTSPQNTYYQLWNIDLRTISAGEWCSSE